MASRRLRNIYEIISCIFILACCVGCTKAPIVAKPETITQGIVGYPELSTYKASPNETMTMRNLLIKILGEIGSETEEENCITAEIGNYTGWFTERQCEMSRIPSKQELTDTSQAKQSADDLIKNFNWEEIEMIEEKTDGHTYCASYALKLDKVPVNGALVHIWLDAEGVQGLSMTEWPGHLEKEDTYDLTSMMDASTVFLSSIEVFQTYARENGRRLPWTGTPELVYIPSETQEKLSLAWKITFEEAYQSTNGEETRVPGYYLVDPASGQILSRVEEEPETGRINFQDWNTLIRCILSPDANIDVSETEDGIGLKLSILNGNDTYTGTIIADSLKFQRTSEGTQQWLPSDEDILILNKNLMEKLKITVASDPVIERDTECLDVYCYFGTMQNNSIYLHYDPYGLQSVQVATGELLQPVQDLFEVEFEALTKIGLEHTTIDQLEPAVAEALKLGGIQMIVSDELPETPEDLSIYTAEFMPVDGDAILKAAFGENPQVAWEKDSTGRHFLLETEYGTYAGAEVDEYLNIGRTSKEAIPCKEEEAAVLGERLLTVPQLHCFSQEYEKAGVSTNGQIRLSYELKLEGIPISKQDVYSSSQDQFGYGTFLQVEYDKEGLYAIHIQQPVLAHRTDQTEHNLISAKDAVDIVEKSMKQAAGNMVQVINDVELNYLNPIENGGQMIPVWKVGYDTIRFASNSVTEVLVNKAEYAYLIDARTGQMHSYH